MFSDFRESLVAVLNSYGRQFRGTGQPVTFAGTVQNSQPKKIRRGVVGQAVRNYFARLQTEIHNRHWRCAARGKELMAQPRRRQTGSLTSIEPVEQRLLLSAVTVDTTLDVVDAGDGVTSLREALTQTNAPGAVDTILFDASLTSAGPATITLDGTKLRITDDVTITGPGADLLTIDADNQSQIFHINHSNPSQNTVEISGLTLTGGNAVFDSGWPESSTTGGAIYSRSNLTVSNSTISGNNAQKSGGGIRNYYGTLTVRNSTISGNESGLYGGGISSKGSFSQDSTLTVSNSTISGNNAQGSGGGINNYYGTVTVSNSTISGNSAYHYGGGIHSYGGYHRDSIVTVSNSTISGNSASRGGGIHNGSYYGDSAVTVSNSTISGNNVRFSKSTAGILNSTYSGDSTITASNSIVAGNTMPGGVASDIKRTGTKGTFTESSSLIGGDWTTFLVNNGSIPTLADNGGPTQTIALLPDSPAINAGNDALLPTGTDYDQRGASFARIVGGTVDIGAFEAPPQPLSLVVDTNSDVVDGDYSAGNLSLREAVELTNANPGFSHTINFGDGSAVDGGTDFTDAVADTITLGGTDMAITGDVTITGTGADLLTIDANKLSRIFNVDDSDEESLSTVEISGLKLTGGKTTSGIRGGAIHNHETLNISNSTISGNDAADGGAIDNRLGTLTVSNSTISGNRTRVAGGGIYNHYGTLTVSNSTISGNSSRYSGGGGIYNNGTLTVSNSTISENVARYRGDGGGIFNNGTLTVSNSTISRNNASFGGGGGAIYSSSRFEDSTLTVSNSTISGNAGSIGGGIHNRSGTSSVSNSTIIGNSAAYGGGIYNQSGTLSVSNSTISANRATFVGGGIFNHGTLTVSNSTISGNTASFGGVERFVNAVGGGIFNNGPLVVSNSIVAGNTLTTGDADDIDGGATGSFNLIGTGGSGGLSSDDGNIVGVDWTTVLETTTDGSDNIFPNLGDNGGPTLTIALLADSRAINAGSNELATDDGTVSGTPLVNDQRGASYDRKVGIVDIGAFEIQNTAPVANDLAVSGVENNDITGQLTASDAESNPLTFVQDTSPSSGTVVVSTNGGFTYSPNANFTGTDTFTFTVSDGSQSDTGTVTITVNPPLSEVHVAVSRRGDLKITGDEGGNVITVEARPGFVSVEGGEFTIVTYAANFNDGARFDRNALIYLGDGANDLTIKETSELPRELVVDTGSGNDRVSILQTKVHRTLRLNTGLGDDIVTLSSLTARKGQIRLGGGNDRLIVRDAVIKKSLHVDADSSSTGGDDWIEFTDVKTKKLSIKMGAGDDEAMLNGVTAKKVTVDGGWGLDELTTSKNNIKKLRVKKVETR